MYVPSHLGSNYVRREDDMMNSVVDGSIVRHEGISIHGSMVFI